MKRWTKPRGRSSPKQPTCPYVLLSKEHVLLSKEHVLLSKEHVFLSKQHVFLSNVVFANRLIENIHAPFVADLK